MPQTLDVLIVGAGIYGATTALVLQGRGYRVAVIDPGPIPHPLAASTDISKVVRMEYGDDADYMAMVESALPGWRQWNDELDDTLYHETGVLMLTRTPMAPGGFEYESYTLLNARGHQPERLDSAAIASRFPAWNAETYVDGFYHAQGGFAESGRVVAALVAEGTRRGIQYHPGQMAQELLIELHQVKGIRTREGEIFNADRVVIAAGAWTPVLIPELASMMRAVGLPVFHLKPDQAEIFVGKHFPVFTADVANTGWYGFPLHPREGVVKIANHGIGQNLHPEHDARQVTEDDAARLRAMLPGTFPALADAPIVYTRLCLYCDTLDEHLWIDHHPEIAGLTVAAGGSGHAFKFAPILGDLIADKIEDRVNVWLPKFAWRDLSPDTAGKEAARHH